MQSTMSRSKIVILTGAGISAESGVATFRDPDGVWAKYDLQDVATPEGFARDPAKVQDFVQAAASASQARSRSLTCPNQLRRGSPSLQAMRSLRTSDEPIPDALDPRHGPLHQLTL
jgi:NAD-dependent SIR2 family protein deacetylase